MMWIIMRRENINLNLGDFVAIRCKELDTRFNQSKFSASSLTAALVKMTMHKFA
jgi:hypothetical protein